MLAIYLIPNMGVIPIFGWVIGFPINSEHWDAAVMKCLQQNLFFWEQVFAFKLEVKAASTRASLDGFEWMIKLSGGVRFISIWSAAPPQCSSMTDWWIFKINVTLCQSCQSEDQRQKIYFWFLDVPAAMSFFYWCKLCTFQGWLHYVESILRLSQCGTVYASVMLVS